MGLRAYQRRGFEHLYDTGMIVLSEKFGVGIIEGLRIRMGNALYYVNPYNGDHEVIVYEHEIIGFATSVKEANAMAQGKGLI
jgi:hypothetical protein